MDFDVVGTDAASADLEILLMMRAGMDALGMEKSTVHFAHRGVFNSFLRAQGLAEKSVEILRAIDKRRKIGDEKAGELLAGIAGAEKAARILAFTAVEKTPVLTLEKLAAEAVAPAAGTGGAAVDPGVERLRIISTALGELGVSDRFVLDPSITRGLDYYTGIVFETFLDRLPDIGSVCSGGRYNDLASLYTRQSLPGVGASIGIDRLMAAMEELGISGGSTAGPAVLVLFLEESLIGRYHTFAQSLRDAGLAAEVYPEKKKLAVQFAYAEKRGIPLALVCGPDEAAAGTVALKDLRSRESYDGLTLGEATRKATALLQ